MAAKRKTRPEELAAAVLVTDKVEQGVIFIEHCHS
jgi:hypothetical protein